MDNMYFFEVPFTCICEDCKKDFGGIIKRGPLQIGSSILSTGLQEGMNSAEKKLSKTLIEGDLANGTRKYFTVENDGKCPHCNIRQSWYSMAEPKKSLGIGLYVLALIVFPLLGMLLWGIIFFDAILPFVIIMTLSVFLAIFLPYRFNKKHKKEELELYEQQKQDYQAYLEVMKNKTEHNKPQIDWDKARYVPV